MNRMTIYTSFSFILDSFDLALRQKYQDDHFHIVTFRDHPARLLEKITRDVKSGEPSADLVLTPHWMVLDLQLRGLLRRHNSKEFEAYPKEFYDADGTWGAMALSPVGMTYNTNLVAESDSPKTLDQALDPKWAGKMAVHSILENIEGRMGLAYLVSLKRILAEDRWNEIIDKLKQLQPRAYECMPEMALSVGKGEKHLGFPATLACISYYLDVQNRPVKFKMPEDIPNMVTFSPTIGLVKNGASPEIAEKAFDYALSEDWQQRVSGFGGKIASRPGVAEEGEIPPNAEYFPILDDVRKHQEFLEILRNRLN